MSEKRAYLIQYPDKDLTIMIEDDGEGPRVSTCEAAGPMEYFVNYMRIDGYEPHILISEKLEGEELPRRKWEEIDSESIPHTRLYSTEELEQMEADTHARFLEQFASGTSGG